MVLKPWSLFALIIWLFAHPSLAAIHTAPVILKAKDLGPVQYYPLGRYQVFASTLDGVPVPIPFQLDEKDHYGDYILPKGKNPNSKFSDKVFSFEDELVVMGKDIGPVKVPSKWAKGTKPAALYEVKFSYKEKAGAIYVAIYHKVPPSVISRNRYVKFDLGKAEIQTNRYNYRFSNANYLVVRGIDLKKGNQLIKLINSSTFYVRINLKYFISLNINESDIDSELDAYKSGPIRTIARVNFTYKLLSMKIDLGMYTEVSFFANSVELPAVIDNPLNGDRSLNSDSLFYYGFAFFENPTKDVKIKSNMARYNKSAPFQQIPSAKGTKEDDYWLTALGKNYMIYIDFQPSKQMISSGNVPQVYVEDNRAFALQARKKSASALGEAPVNVAVSFNMQKLNVGIHPVRFKVLIENFADENLLNSYKTLDDWKVTKRRLASQQF